MKAKIIFLVILMLTVSRLAYAGYKIQFDAEANRVLQMGGRTLVGDFATPQEAENYQNSRPAFERNHSQIVPPSTSSPGSPNSPSVPPPTNQGQGGRSRGYNATSEAEQKAIKKRQEAFDRENNKLLMGLKGGTATGVPGLKTGTTSLPLKGSGNAQSIGLKTYDTTVKEKTIKALKQLHGSVYWGLKAVNAALDARDEVTGAGNLDDKWALARRYAENSAQARSGSFVSGSPEFKVSIPDVPPPVEANPQIQLYNYISQQTKKLVPDIIETQKAIEKTKQYSKDIEKKKHENRDEIEPIASKIITTNDPKEKAELVATYEEKNREYDELTTQTEELEQEAKGLKRQISYERETYAALQKSNDAAQANPDSAQELLKNLQKK